ncbi:MAG: tetratricopeptide repeat protein [bacterium]|nr:tetratricopeptide repeat protein [bacterium]
MALEQPVPCRNTLLSDRKQRTFSQNMGINGFCIFSYMAKNLELALKYTQQSLELSRDFSTAATFASSLSNIALVQLQLGQPKDALLTLEEAITIVRGVSRNYLAAFLVNKAEILCYLGDFAEAKVFF